ncbi:hypothetical protein HX038_15570 [Myroides odoratimimus]|uniref:hypothetical protein n=1 Tax=Myroides odoratimimus TaxID=76832 RepID=UPI0025778172|nr:hypothetical protein [Myroides odoratimimus]MDM1412155.1 hypothetical protein [Myroides odoratimimus]
MDIVKKYCFILLFTFSQLPLIAQNDTLVLKNSNDFQQFVNSNIHPKVLIFQEGNYFLDRPIFFENDIEIIGRSDRGVIIQATKEMNYFFRAKSSINLQNVILDGDKLVPYGIMAFGDVFMDNSTVKNLFGNRKLSGIGIRSNSSNRKITIRNSNFENITGFEDGIEGNSVGAHRGLFLKGGDIIIDRCKFLNILGEEDSDSIQIQDDKNSKSKTVISNCIFENFGKRAIKISIPNNVIKNNFFYNTNDSCYVVIGLIGSSYNFVYDNFFDAHVKLAFVSMSNSKGIDIKNNLIKANFSEENANVFYIKNVENLNVFDNVIEMKKPLINKLIRNRNKRNVELFIDSDQIKYVN